MVNESVRDTTENCCKSYFYSCKVASVYSRMSVNVWVKKITVNNYLHTKHTHSRKTDSLEIK
jgi:hypothetical protein